MVGLVSCCLASRCCRIAILNISYETLRRCHSKGLLAPTLLSELLRAGRLNNGKRATERDAGPLLIPRGRAPNAPGWGTGASYAGAVQSPTYETNSCPSLTVVDVALLSRPPRAHSTTVCFRPAPSNDHTPSPTHTAASCFLCSDLASSLTKTSFRIHAGAI